MVSPHAYTDFCSAVYSDLCACTVLFVVSSLSQAFCSGHSPVAPDRGQLCFFNLDSRALTTLSLPGLSLEILCAVTWGHCRAYLVGFPTFRDHSLLPSSYGLKSLFFVVFCFVLCTFSLLIISSRRESVSSLLFLLLCFLKNFFIETFIQLNSGSFTGVWFEVCSDPKRVSLAVSFLASAQ